MDFWQPVADYLSKAVPDRRFVIVPLASRQDVDGSLEKGHVDFVVLDPALEIRANDRYGAAPLATMVESAQDPSQPKPSNAGSSGTLIFRAGRRDIATIKDIRGKRLAAVKPWSLTGWIAQWGLLKQSGIDPQKDLKQVVFDGVDVEVVRSILDDAADVGAVDSAVVLHLIRAGQVPKDSLCFINRQGRAAPLALGEEVASTDAYPGWVLSRTETVSDELGQQVADALMKQGVDVSVDGVPYRVDWTVASNYGVVRRLLRTLMGPDYAESPGFPLPRRYPAWLLPGLTIVGSLAVLAAAVLLLRNYHGRREIAMKRQLNDMRRELLESRAQLQHINAILSLAGCGIDIVDDENRIVYADAALEREHGDWRGRKCHEYYCGSDTPCPNCRRPAPSDEQRQMALDMDGSEPAPMGDPHAKVHYINGESTRMIGIPFRDEGGRWLYARVHFPLAAFATANNP